MMKPTTVSCRTLLLATGMPLIGLFRVTGDRGAFNVLKCRRRKVKPWTGSSDICPVLTTILSMSLLICSQKP